MRWACDAVYSWLGGVLSVRAHEVSCRVRAGEVARPAIVSGWKRRRLHPKGPQAAPGSDFGGPVGSPASIHGVRRCPRPMDEVRVERKGRPAAGKARLAWVTTVTGDANHVTFCEISVSCLGQTFKGLQNPTTRRISAGIPACSHFVIISLCDVDHNSPPAKRGVTRPGSGPH
jgi:hypothetical protein